MGTKTRIVTQLADKAGVDKKGIAGLWDLLLSLAIEETKAGGEFMLPGIGKIALDRRKARTGRNPQTGQPMLIPPKTTLRFRFAKTFKAAVMPEEEGPAPRPEPRGESATRPASVGPTAKKPRTP